MYLDKVFKFFNVVHPLLLSSYSLTKINLMCVFKNKSPKNLVIIFLIKQLKNFFFFFQKNKK